MKNIEKIRHKDSIIKKTGMDVQISAFLAYISLVWGILLILGDFGNFSYRHGLVLGSGLLLGTGLWFGLKWGREGRRTVFVLFALYAGILLLQRQEMQKQLASLLLCLIKMEEGTGDFTLLFVGFSFLLSLFCPLVVFVLKKGWLFYSLTLTLLLLGPMFGYRPPWLILGLLVIFHIGDSLYHGVYQKWSDEAKEGNTRAVVLQRGFMAGIAVVLAAFFLARLIPVGSRKSWLKNSVQLTWNWTQGVKNQMGLETGSGANGPSGKINRGNYFSSGTIQMEVTLSEKPEERIYLKSFTGRNYQQDGWEEADETDFYLQFDEHQEDYHKYFEQRQFMQIQYGKRNDWEGEGEKSNALPWVSEEYKAWSGIQQMRIWLANPLQTAFYQPYLAAYTSHDAEGGEHFTCFTWKEFEWYYQKHREDALAWPELYDRLEELYQDYAEENYLDVPEERLPRLLALCRENPLEEPEEIITFVRKTLTEYAAYSQTPGFMPYGTDIAEYFLFDGQEGYCQHFATAAVLMYRMYGIPARYAAGYMALPQDFTQGRDGQYYAQLTDGKAHAWVEIYLGGPGWFPVEVTPPSETSSAGGREQVPKVPEGEEETEENGDENENGNRLLNQKDLLVQNERPVEETPGETRSVLDELGLWEKEPDLQEDDTNSKRMEKTLAENETNPLGQDPTSKDAYGYGRIIAPIFTALGIVLFLSGAVWALRRFKRKKLGKMGADEVYQEMVDVLHLAGYLKDFDGTEPDFPETLIQQLAGETPKRERKSAGQIPGREPKAAGKAQEREQKSAEQIPGREPKAAGKAQERERKSARQLLSRKPKLAGKVIEKKRRIRLHRGNAPGKKRKQIRIDVSLEEVRRLRSYAFQTAYGPIPSSDKERKEAVEIYGKLYRFLLRHTRRMKRVKVALRGVV